MLVPRTHSYQAYAKVKGTAVINPIEEKVRCAYDSEASGFIIRHEHSLHELPPCIKVLRSQLELLIIDNNYNLRALPGFLGDFLFLRVLDASYCRIKNVDPRLGCLRRLEHLNLANNQLEYLSFEASRLKSLKKLNVENNNMKVLPGGLLFLQHLKELTLENNPFYDPVEIEGTPDVTLSPCLSSIECVNCCIPTQNYRTFISFHRLCQHVELPFVFHTCSDTCQAQVRDRLDRYNAAQRERREHQ
ncbi:unnamed protein product [Phytomonas sp. EM1]|nr:unnamed protein product [Phytomonas sp. EM1]|eukprot:CCW65246.1 unnamed protein product [Phytomonas sp. isolate EM1]